MLHEPIRLLLCFPSFLFVQGGGLSTVVEVLLTATPGSFSALETSTAELAADPTGLFDAQFEAKYNIPPRDSRPQRDAAMMNAAPANGPAKGFVKPLDIYFAVDGNPTYFAGTNAYYLLNRCARVLRCRVCVPYTARGAVLASTRARAHQHRHLRAHTHAQHPRETLAARSRPTTRSSSSSACRRCAASTSRASSRSSTATAST